MIKLNNARQCVRIIFPNTIQCSLNIITMNCFDIFNAPYSQWPCKYLTLVSWWLWIDTLFPNYFIHCKAFHCIVKANHLLIVVAYEGTVREGIIIAGHQLEMGTKYLIAMKGSFNDSSATPNYVYRVFRTNYPPYNGECQVNTSAGRFIRTDSSYGKPYIHFCFVLCGFPRVTLSIN